FRLYWRHLKPNGILAVNISNKYLNLQPVMERAAAAFGKVAMVYVFEARENDLNCFNSIWTLMMDRATLDRHPELHARGRELKPGHPFRVWTDDYSNIYSILK